MAGLTYIGGVGDDVHERSHGRLGDAGRVLDFLNKNKVHQHLDNQQLHSDHVCSPVHRVCAERSVVRLETCVYETVLIQKRSSSRSACVMRRYQEFTCFGQSEPHDKQVRVNSRHVHAQSRHEILDHATLHQHFELLEVLRIDTADGKG